MVVLCSLSPNAGAPSTKLTDDLPRIIYLLSAYCVFQHCARLQTLADPEIKTQVQVVYLREGTRRPWR